MNPPRKLPPVSNQTVANWLSGHAERVFARTPCFTFSLAIQGGYVAFIEDYDQPERIPRSVRKTALPAKTALKEVLQRWMEPIDKRTTIRWAFTIVPASECLAVQVRDLTESNQHTWAMMSVSEAFGMKELFEQFCGIAEDQKRDGYFTKENNRKRQDLYNEMMKTCCWPEVEMETEVVA